jgi:hypothetical protein
MKNYVLVVHSPFNPIDTLATLRSETPFQAVHEGDLLDPAAYDLEDYEDLESQLLRITGVQHFITLTDDLNSAKHQIDIFTEVEPDTVIMRKITRAESDDESREVAKQKLAELLNISPDQLPD